MSLISERALDPRYREHAGEVLGKLGRAHLPDFLKASTADEYFAAMQSLEWWLTFRDGKSVAEGNLAQFEAMAPQRRDAIMQRIVKQAASEFQYVFDKHRISDAIEQGKPCDPMMAAAYNALNSDAALAYFRALTGDDRIAYVDAQATRYRAGHFLMLHHDQVEHAERLYAYVLNLTPKWRCEWGGLLMFVSDDGHVAEAYTPCWNALNIFKVPQAHTVSLVAPFAEGGRYSITGWMRADKPKITSSLAS